MMPDDKVIPVRVALRCRPIVPREEAEGCRGCVQFVPNESQIILGKDKNFTYDYVFSPDTPQQEVYEKSVFKLVKGIFKGYNATVLAYGQTGSGKTFTMGGGYGECYDEDDQINGVIPRVIRDLFIGIQERAEENDFVVKVSYIELYKEDLHDLLQPPTRREPIQIREEAAGGIKLMGLTERDVADTEQTLECLVTGAKGRTTGATAMNSTSSRSHAIFTLHVERRSKTQEDDLCRAKFHLVDLAGSERAKRTQAEGERFKEGVNINKGLLALGNVISALGEDSSKRNHIPYRDSKLTRLLQDSLGGNSHTVMVACISPADSNMEETLSTLRYADRARKIKNKPIVNRDPQTAEIVRLRQLVQELQVQMLQGGKITNMSCSMATVSSSDDLSEAHRALKEQYEELETATCGIQRDLRSAWAQNNVLMEQNINLEMTNEKLTGVIEKVTERTGMSISRLETTQVISLSPSKQAALGAGDGPPQDDDSEEDPLNMLREIHKEITAAKKDKALALTTIDEEAGPPGVPSESPDTSISDEEQMNKQAEFQRRLAELNDQLHRKESVVKQMMQNDEAMSVMKNKYETDKMDLVKQIDKLNAERENLMHELESAKHNTASNKVAEQRRKRLKELEEQLSKAKKTLKDQSKVVKMKEHSDTQLKKMTEEIKDMKQKRVKLVKQMREEAENFRKWKQAKDKEVLQLKAKDRKRQIEMVKLQRTNERQQTVYRRKAEEAGAANKRLKEALAKQKMVQDERNKKQEVNDMSGIGARIRKWLSQELEVLVSVEEAKHHLDGLKQDRGDLVRQLKAAKDKLESRPSPVKRKMSGEGVSQDADKDTEALVKETKLLQAEIDLRSAQISDLQEKVMDAGQDDKTKSRWQNVHTMVEAKCAMKFLLNEAVSSRVGESKQRLKGEDASTRKDEELQEMKNSLENLRQEKQQTETELVEMQKEYENKVLYLLSQLKHSDSSNQMLENTQDEELKERLKFQEREIERLSALEEKLEKRTQEYHRLQKELTRANYNLTLGRDGTLMPDIGNNIEPQSTGSKEDSKFFSPAFLKSPLKKKRPPKSTVYMTLNDDSYVSENSDDDETNDPCWERGCTPGNGNLPRASKRRRVTMTFKSDTDMPTLSGSLDLVSPPNIAEQEPEACTCSGKCIRCPCTRLKRACTEMCRCQAAKCRNRLRVAIKEEEEEGDGELDTTYITTPSTDLLEITASSNVTASSADDSTSRANKSSLGKTAADALYKENRPSIEDPADPLNGGIVRKKRKLLGQTSGFFGSIQT